MRVIVAATLVLVFTSCGRKENKETTLESRNFAVERETFFNTIHNHPDEVALKLVPGLTGFNAEMLNDAARFDQYVGNDVKAASNLGIYLADLNYCILFTESSLVKQYFDAAYELSKAIGIEKNVLDLLSKRYAENIARHDSVNLVMQQLLEQSTKGLQGTEREKLAGVAMAAYQIENLHLVLATLETFPENLDEEQLQSQTLLLQYIVNQQGKFEITYNFIKSFSDPLDPGKNPNYPFYDNALRELITAYRKLLQEEQSGEDKVKQLSDGTIQLKDYTALKDLTEKVEAIRTKIISVD